MEYVISRNNTKQRLIDANKKLSNAEDYLSKPTDTQPKLNHNLSPSATSSTNASFTTSTPTNAEKKVKLMLHLNRSQEESEYIQQLISTPKIPYDSAKKPGKGLLKPNLVPSPINPYYKQKIGLEF